MRDKFKIACPDRGRSLHMPVILLRKSRRGNRSHPRTRAPFESAVPAQSVPLLQLTRLSPPSQLLLTLYTAPTFLSTSLNGSIAWNTLAKKRQELPEGSSSGFIFEATRRLEEKSEGQFQEYARE